MTSETKKRAFGWELNKVLLDTNTALTQLQVKMEAQNEFQRQSYDNTCATLRAFAEYDKTVKTQLNGFDTLNRVTIAGLEIRVITVEKAFADTQAALATTRAELAESRAELATLKAAMAKLIGDDSSAQPPPTKKRK